MRTNSALGRTVSLVLTTGVLTGAAFLFGCGGSKPAPLVYPPRTVNAPDVTHGATVSGTVTFEGQAPKPRILSNADAWCNRQSKPIPDESLLVDAKTSGLANVFVYVSKGLENYVFDYEKAPVKVDQTDCIFKPHVLGVRRYQPVDFVNDDQTTHNVNTTTSQKRQGGSITMAPGGTKTTRQFTENELMLAGSCDIHSNMLMYFHIVDHPDFAVTDSEGKWAFPTKLPAGSYEIEYVHERCGKSSQMLTVTPDGTVTMTATMKFSRK